MNKTCNKCGTNKPLNERFFRADAKCKSGFRSVCKKCSDEGKRLFRKTPQGRRETAEYQKKWRERNPDYQKYWLAQNPDYHRKWHEKNPGKAYSGYKRWLNEILTPEERLNHNKAHAHRRRAKKLDAGGKFTRHDVKRILEAQKHRCWWCSCRLDKHHMDHRIPLSRGGANDPSNLVASCPPCNQRKSSKMPWELLDNPRLL